MSEVVQEDVERTIHSLEGLESRLDGKTALITGATGMVGQAVTRTCIAIARQLRGSARVIAQVRSLQKAEMLYRPELDRGELQLVIGDVADRAILEAAAADYVVHAASPAAPSAFRDDPVGVIRANVDGTLAALECARRGRGRLTLVSTMEIYGAAERTDGTDVWLREDDMGILDPLDLRSAYPESKRVAENACVAYCAQHGVGSDVVRLSHTYGPGMAWDDGRVQAQFVRQALAGESIVLRSDGSLQRTYTYIADAASAIMRIMLTGLGSTDVRVFNVANGGSRTTIRGLAEQVLLAAGRSRNDVVIDRPADIADQMWSRAPGSVYLDSSRLHDLGWRPKHDLASGLERTVRHNRRLFVRRGWI